MGEVLARDEIKPARAGRRPDHGHPCARLWRPPPRLALFTVHEWSGGARAGREGLNNASGYFRQAHRAAAADEGRARVKFEVDTVFERPKRREAAARGSPRARAERRAAGEQRTADAEVDRRLTSGGVDRRLGRGGRRSTPSWSIDKPLGPDVVRRGAARAAARRRARGSGTAARWIRGPGVLPICLGEATKLAQFLLDADKEYDFTVCFGRRDRHRRRGGDGHRAPRRGRRRRGGRAARAGGVPRRRSRRCRPMYSALKRDGRPLYDYARAGEAVEAAPRGGGRPRAGADVVRAARRRCAARCAVRRGRTCGRWRRPRPGPGRGRARDRPAPDALGAFALAEARPLDEVLAALDRRANRRRCRWSRAPTPAPPRPAGRDRRRGAATPASAGAIAMGTAVEAGVTTGDRRLCLLDSRGKLVAVGRAARRTRRSRLLRVFTPNSLTIPTFSGTFPTTRKEKERNNGPRSGT